MATTMIGPKPAFTPLKLPPNAVAALGAGADTSGKVTPAMAKKARETATGFEQMFLNQMFSQMFTGVEGDGPMGGAGAAGVWRSFLTDEYAKNFAKAGGIGLGDHIYRQLIAQQEARPT